MVSDCPRSRARRCSYSLQASSPDGPRRAGRLAAAGGSLHPPLPGDGSEPKNLLTNAIKYGAGKPIAVRLEASPERLTLSVRDQGIGIAPEHQARIFERFERAVSERNYGGLGLGLYITRTILEALGGTIRVQSEPGQGACFTVELPLEPLVP